MTNGDLLRHDRRAVAAMLALATLAACGRGSPMQAPPAGAAETQTSAETRWTPNLEWFVEHTVLVVGQESSFAVHLTRLDGFTPVDSGRLSVVLSAADGAAQQQAEVDSPGRPGIFFPSLTPQQPGAGRLHLTYTGPEGQIDEVGWQVFVAAFVADLEKESEEVGGVPFLKEQQWRIPFATATVAEVSLAETIDLPAALEVHPGHVAVVAAPAAGVLQAPAGGLPIPGTPVRRGQVLASIVPLPGAVAGWHTLEAELVEARNRVQAAEDEHSRAGRLVEAGVVPVRRLRHAALELENARAYLAAVELRRSGLNREATDSAGSLLLHAPISGTVATLGVTAGEPVDTEQTLFRIIDLSHLVVRVEVPEPELHHLLQQHAVGQPLTAAIRPSSLKGASGAVYTAATRTSAGWAPTGALLDLATQVVPTTRTGPLLYSFDNEDGRFRPGMTATARIRVHEPRTVLAVPEEALLTLAGVDVVYVQLAGETFEERTVHLGIKDHGMVEILSGVEPGERVVVRGAYLVRLAALSPDAAPAHAH